MVIHVLAKDEIGVRFPLPAPLNRNCSLDGQFLFSLNWIREIGLEGGWGNDSFPNAEYTNRWVRECSVTSRTLSDFPLPAPIKSTQSRVFLHILFIQYPSCIERYTLHVISYTFLSWRRTLRPNYIRLNCWT